MARLLVLPDADSRSDLAQFLRRAARFDASAVRIAGHGPVALVTVPTSPSEGLFDAAPSILGARAIRVAEPLHADAVVPLVETVAALAEDADLALPEPGVVPAWAAFSPPRSDWEQVGVVDAEVVRAAAHQADEEIAKALPALAGEAVVRRVRRQVWGESVHALPSLSRGMAAALVGLGFLTEAPVRVTRSGTWLRASTPLGDVLQH